MLTAGGLGAGAGIVLLAMAIVLLLLGVFVEFFEILTYYLPLYGSMTAGHRVIPASERMSYLFDAWFLFGPQYPWALGAALGAGAYFAASADERAHERRFAGLVVGMALAFALYPAIAGQYWKYHWLPYVYWILACSSLVFARIRSWRDLRAVWVPMFLILVLILGTVRPDRQWGRLLTIHLASEGTAPSEIADYLGKHMLPGDKVQAMDWTNAGVVHGLLLAEAPPATSFIYDFHFYHHVSTDYIRGLRTRFLNELEASKARFLVRGKVGPFPTGPDTGAEFPELAALLQREYRQVFDRPTYEIFERSH
jgi:hypothetical protein